MKLFTTILFVFLLSMVVKAQGLINNGAQIVFSGASQMYIDNITNGNYLSQSGGLITPSATSTITVLKNWTNNSTNNAFTTDAGGVVLAGNAQAIGGTNASAFYNLSLTGNGVKTLAVNSTTVGGQATFTGILAIGTSTLDLNANRLDVTNPAISAMTHAATGYIISETPLAVNNSIIRWYIRTTNGSHVYPFGVGGLKIPFTFNITTAMAGANDFVDVSTRATGTNNQPWAGISNVAAVGNMTSPNTSPTGAYVDGSVEVVIDRWWDITPSSAVTSDVTFSYRGIENTLLPIYQVDVVGPQYWSGSTGGWVNYNQIIGAGAAAVTSGVGNVTATGLTTFCPWVLSAKLHPLPIELLNFEANCLNNETVIEWCTATEKNNNYFTVQQSTDGFHYTTLATVNGNGTTGSKSCYKYTTAAFTSGINYYRLLQTDYNGTSNEFKTVSVESCNSKTDNVVLTNSGTKEIGVLVNSSRDTKLKLFIHNTLGQVIDTRELDVKTGYNTLSVNLSYLSNAMYYVSVYDNAKQLTSKKVVVADLQN